MLRDADIIAELRTSGDRRYVSGPTSETPYDYPVLDVRVPENVVDFEVRQRDGLAARIQVPLPSADASPYWLYYPPEDAADWVSQLLLSLDEEVFTLGLEPIRSRVEHEGDSYVVAESYGWRVADPQEHMRLEARAGHRSRCGDAEGR